MLTPERTTLIEIMAKVDALFWPSRDRFNQRRAQVRHERQVAYRETGLTITGGGSAAERQAFGRLLDSLQVAGLVTIIRGKRREGVKLTALGDNVTRKICACYTIAEAWGLLELAGELDRRAFGRSLPDHFFIGLDAWQGTPEENAAMGMMRQKLVPFLPVDYISCSGDGAPIRMYWMGLTDTGRAALDAGPPDDAPEGIEYDKEAGDEEDVQWHRAIAELDAAEPANPSDLVIPVCCGIGWGMSMPQWFEEPR
jgi:hypothetical protein